MPGADQPSPLASSSWNGPASAALRRVLLATDLAELARQYSTLEPTGVDSVLRGNCPLRPDDTPLFFVSHSETFHCLGCGAHGNALEFLMQVDGIGPARALQKLENFVESCQAGCQADSRNPKRSNALAQVHAHAAKFYADQLNRSSDAIAYLNRRGITDETAAYWMLGYAPDSWHAIQDALNEHPVELLVTAGLLVQRDGGRPYDRFRGRLMFPIRGLSGDMIAFGGRTLGQGEPKYLNSPETPSFRKGQILYGQYESTQVDASVDRLWVVEGYMDVITLWQQGIRNCTATLGTSTNTEQILRLFQTTTDLLYCFDGDKAGRSAAWRALERTLPALRRGRRAHFLILPEGEDPDTLVRKGGTHALQSLADQALPLPLFLSQELSAIYDTSHADGRVLYLERAAELLRQVSDRDWRSDLSAELAERAGVSPSTIERLADAPRATTRMRQARPRNFVR